MLEPLSEKDNVGESVGWQGLNELSYDSLIWKQFDMEARNSMQGSTLEMVIWEFLHIHAI